MRIGRVFDTGSTWQGNQLSVLNTNISRLGVTLSVRTRAMRYRFCFYNNAPGSLPYRSDEGVQSGLEIVAEIEKFRLDDFSFFARL